LALTPSTMPTSTRLFAITCRCRPPSNPPDWPDWRATQRAGTHVTRADAARVLLADALERRSRREPLGQGPTLCGISWLRPAAPVHRERPDDPNRAHEIGYRGHEQSSPRRVSAGRCLDPGGAPGAGSPPAILGLPEASPELRDGDQQPAADRPRWAGQAGADPSAEPESTHHLRAETEPLIPSDGSGHPGQASPDQQRGVSRPQDRPRKAPRCIQNPRNW
jgi:hypothetical protein